MRCRTAPEAPGRSYRIGQNGIRALLRGVCRGCASLLIVGAWALDVGSASATPVYPQPDIRTWSHPGSTHPCGTSCGREWALKEMADQGVLPDPIHAAIRQQIDHGVPSEYFVTTGDYMPAMSYAIDGVPYMSTKPLVAGFGEERYRAVGYSVVDGHTVYRFVRVDECGNWTLVVDSAEETGPAALIAPPPFVSPDAVALGPLFLPWPGWMVASGPDIDTKGRGSDNPGSPGPGPNEKPPLSIPLPTTGLLLASALAALAWRRSRAGGRRRMPA